MVLSYTCRLLCLVFCGAGLLQIVLECTGWMLAPTLLQRAAEANARRAERLLFALALGARLGPWLIVLALWAPAYMHGEDNVSAERVGLFCLAGAAAVLAGSVLCSARVLRAWLSVRRCCRLCCEVTQPEGWNFLLHPGNTPLMAAVGVFRSRIIVSQGVLASERFSAATLNIAFRHEGAHIRQHDNLKLLLLSWLPHLSFRTRVRSSLAQQWRLAAELAADEDGAMNQPERSVLLAELLVTMARESRECVPQGSFALLSRGEDLRVRIDRLLRGKQAAPAQQDQSTASHSRLQRRCAMGVGFALLTALCYGCALCGHSAAEMLLHLG